MNAVVAIALGAIVQHESLTWTIAAAACVAIVVQRDSIPPEAVGAGVAETYPPR